MKPEDVPAEWVERAAEELIGSWDGAWIAMEIARQMAADALAAVLPEIQAQALRDAKAWIKASSDLSTLDGDWAKAWNLSTSHALAVLDDRAARLAATTEGTKS